MKYQLFLPTLLLTFIPTLLFGVPHSLGRLNKPGLTIEDATFRANQLSEVEYDLYFDLTQTKSESFSGVSNIRFTLKSLPSKLKDKITVDFKDGRLKEVILNGTAIYLAAPSKAKSRTKTRGKSKVNAKIKGIDYLGNFLVLPSELLKKGKNELSVSFDQNFSKTGAGLYRFTDPEDKRQYLYTDFEPFDANRLFPSFDQPDLKARYQLDVLAPSKWVVVTNTLETQVVDLNNQTKIWKFPRTKAFSTYIFSLHAGPYHFWSYKKGTVPFRLFARKSFSKYVDHKEWFKVTQQGFEFFEDYFDTKYPFFKKYDQLIVPDFNSGAMENVGAVTFSERRIKKGKPTREQKESIANVILHELAHMWFGNLVTMKWWDGLWLNESFATFMANLALVENTEYKNAWQSFYSGTKQWAYWEDQLVTTHPIQGFVKNTGEAFANFDGITYGKGASVMKQVRFYLGKNEFRNGVRRYFKKHPYGNATLSDFMGALEKTSGKDMSKWTEKWLKSAGLNQIQVAFTCKNREISNFLLNQSSASGEKTERMHRAVIGLYKKDGDGVELYKKLPISYSKKETSISELEGEDCPDLVYPNQGDFDFVKVTLDPQTLKQVPGLLSKIESPLLRAMFWQALWDMVRDSKLEVSRFVDLAVKLLPHEKDTKLATRVTKRLVGSYSSAFAYYSVKAKKYRALREDFLSRLQKFFWQELNRAEAGSDFQKLWFRSFIKVASMGDSEKKLIDLINNKVTFQKLEVSQDDRWSIIVRLGRMGSKVTQKLKVAELKKDLSEKGKKSAMISEAIWPSKKAKKKWFREINNSKSKLPLARKKAILWSLFPVEQNHFRKQFSPQFYSSLKSKAGNGKPEFLTTYTASLVPTTCDAKGARILEKFIKKNKKLPAYITKKLRVAHDEDLRCHSILNFSFKDKGSSLN